VFIPIPLHPRRQRERGFNQSALLAEALSRDTKIPVADILVRHKSTWAQSSLPPELRAANIKNSFSLKETYFDDIPIGRRLVILVDDVTTSGSTLRSAADALFPASAKASAGKPAHFKSIWGLTVARG
jgi:competence protein ComFC